MSSEESDDAWSEGVGPRPRKIKKLPWERSKLRNIKAVLDRHYTSSVSDRQKRTQGAVSRDGEQSTRAAPKESPSWAVYRDF